MNWQRILCWFGSHAYGRWRNNGRYPVPQPFDERKCSRCGFKDIRDALLAPPRPQKKRRPATDADTVHG